MTWDGPASGERLFLLAPHPDDETLAAGGLLQRVLSRGGQAIAVFATDGENNPWTQRLVERRLRVRPQDCVRFGKIRRREALDALAVLGLQAGDAVFLGFPDQAVTDVLLRDAEAAVDRIETLLREWRPTVLLAPCLFDLHPDHSASAVLIRLALSRLDAARRPRLLSYLIHQTRSAAAAAAGSRLALRFEPSETEKDRKRRAIGCHATQLAVHRKKFLSSADRAEIFYQEAPPEADGLHPVHHARRAAGALRMELVLRPRLGAFGRPTLRLSGGDGSTRRTLSFDLRWRHGGAEVRDLLTDRMAGRAALRGGRRGGVVEVPKGALPGPDRIYVKLERRFGFFDEGGWLEVDAESSE